MRRLPHKRYRPEVLSCCPQSYQECRTDWDSSGPSGYTLRMNGSAKISRVALMCNHFRPEIFRVRTEKTCRQRFLFFQQKRYDLLRSRRRARISCPIPPHLQASSAPYLSRGTELDSDLPGFSRESSTATVSATGPADVYVERSAMLRSLGWEAENAEDYRFFLCTNRMLPMTKPSRLKKRRPRFFYTNLELIGEEYDWSRDNLSGMWKCFNPHWHSAVFPRRCFHGRTKTTRTAKC